MRTVLKILFILFYLSIYSQVDKSKIKLPKSSKKLYKLALKAYESEDYFLSKLYYDELESRGYKSSAQLFNHSILLYKIGDYGKFSENLDFLEKEKYSNKLLPYYQVIAAMKSNNIAKAKDYSSFFLKDKSNKREYKSFYDHITKIKKNLDKIADDISKEYNIFNIKGDINGPAADFNPIITSDGLIYGHQILETVDYFSKKDIEKSSQKSTRKIMKAEGSDSIFSRVDYFPIVIKDMEISGFCFDLKMRVMYLTGCKYDEDSMKYLCSIFRSKNIDQEWTLPEPVEELNYKGANSSHITMGYDYDRKSNILFFSSNRKGTKGGMDIWMSYQSPRTQKFTKPRNLGRLINTAKDEITPFFHSPTKRLYFSTDGRGGVGGYDIYYSSLVKGVFSKVKTLGREVNSPQDDVFFTPDIVTTRGYFVSNRYSENSLLNPHCCDDIFYFEKIKHEEANNSVTNKSKALEYFTVNVTNNESKLEMKKFNITINKIDSNLNKYLVESTTAIDSYTYKDVEKNFDYEVEVDVPEFYRKKKYIRPLIDTSNSVNIEVEKINYDPIILPLVEFEFDSFTLTYIARGIIDSMVAPVLISNPTLMVELSAHTDSRGSDKYNDRLSDRRARSIYNYLINFHNIDKRRLKYKGYGERVPIAPNKNPDGTDNPEGRQRNRRCEFRILKTRFDPY